MKTFKVKQVLNLVAALSACLGISQIAQANSFPGVPTNAFSKKAQSTFQAGSASCPDFSGQWTGSCYSNQSTQPDQMDLAQTGCERLVLKVGNGRSYKLSLDLTGATLSTESGSDSFGTYSNIFGAGWAENRSMLLVRGTLAHARLGTIPSVLSFSAELMMDKADLVIFSKISGNLDFESSCRYSKVP